VNRREFLGAGLGALPVLGGRPGAWLAGASREPVALATADTEAHVVEVALASGRVRRRLPTVEDPRSIESGRGGVAVVGHTASGAVSLLEGRPLRVRRVLRGFVEPRYTAVAPDGRHAFVTDSGAGELAVVDLERGRVVRRVAVGEHARHLSLDPAGRTLWIGLGSSAAEIAVVSVADRVHPRPLRRVRPPFLAHDVGFSPSGRRVWVTAGRERRIAIYRAGAHTPSVLLGADAAPQHVTFGPGAAYVASGDGGSVRLHALDDGRLLRTTRVPIGSYNVQRARSRILTPSLAHGTLTILDPHGRVLHEVRVAPAAHDACAVA
jgi:DNA-binding beta-propeller fold protein YncE